MNSNLFNSNKDVTTFSYKKNNNYFTLEIDNQPVVKYCLTKAYLSKVSSKLTYSEDVNGKIETRGITLPSIDYELTTEYYDYSTAGLLNEADDRFKVVTSIFEKYFTGLMKGLLFPKFVREGEQSRKLMMDSLFETGELVIGKERVTEDASPDIREVDITSARYILSVFSTVNGNSRVYTADYSHELETNLESDVGLYEPCQLINNVKGKIVYGTRDEILGYVKSLMSTPIAPLDKAQLIVSRTKYKKNNPLYSLEIEGEEFVSVRFGSVKPRGKSLYIGYNITKLGITEYKEDVVPSSAFPDYRPELTFNKLGEIFEKHFVSLLWFELYEELSELTPPEQGRVTDSIFGKGFLRL